MKSVYAILQRLVLISITLLSFLPLINSACERSLAGGLLIPGSLLNLKNILWLSIPCCTDWPKIVFIKGNHEDAIYLGHPFFCSTKPIGF